MGTPRNHAIESDIDVYSVKTQPILFQFDQILSPYIIKRPVLELRQEIIRKYQALGDLGDRSRCLKLVLEKEPNNNDCSIFDMHVSFRTYMSRGMVLRRAYMYNGWIPFAKQNKLRSGQLLSFRVHCQHVWTVSIRNSNASVPRPSSSASLPRPPPPPPARELAATTPMQVKMEDEEDICNWKTPHDESAPIFHLIIKPEHRQKPYLLKVPTRSGFATCMPKKKWFIKLRCKYPKKWYAIWNPDISAIHGFKSLFADIGAEVGDLFVMVLVDAISPTPTIQLHVYKDGYGTPLF